MNTINLIQDALERGIDNKADPQRYNGTLNNHFLIAMPGLKDPYFVQSVTYICEHNQDGAIGLTINHPSSLTVGELFEQLNLDNDNPFMQTPLLMGGPVQTERGFVLHSSEKCWDSTLSIANNISITASKDILVDIANNAGPDKLLVALGYAGWEAGQLEEEMSANSWLTVPADDSIIFDTAIEHRWKAAAQQLGIDVNLIANQAGHA